MTTTADSIRQYLTASMEPANPAAAILAYLRERNGKTLTKRDEPKLQQIDASIYIRRAYGMTNIAWGGYDKTQGREGGSLFIAHTEAAPVIDAAWVEEHNAAYFSARVERNAARMAALADDASIERLADALDAITAAKATIKALCEHGQPLAQVQYAPFMPRWARDT